MQVGEAGNFSDDADVAEALDGFAIFAVLIANHDYAMHLDFGGMQCSECQQGVIDSADATAGGA